MNDESGTAIDLHFVTDDPDVLRDLRARGKNLDTFELARYAQSIGLFPPEYREDVRYGIIMASPAQADFRDDELLLWDTSSFGDDPDLRVTGRRGTAAGRRDDRSTRRRR